MPPLRLRVLALLGVLALGPAAAFPEEEEGEAAEATPEQQVDALVEAYGVRAGGPGVGVLVLDEKQVLLKRCYGLANLGARTPITPSTTFELASVSKHVTGAAVLLLVQRGKAQLGDDVRKHLPELPAYDPPHPITLDHLSRHLSGLPDYLAWDDALAAKAPFLTNADVLREFARRQESAPLASVPGEEYDYSNSGYMLLGTLVERLSGRSFGAFLAQEFFVPFGMKTAWVHESPRVPSAATAVGYTRDDGRWKATWSAPSAQRHEKVLTVGDGGVWASLDDLAAWDRGLRAGRYLRTETLLGALAPGRTRGGQPVPYALGWEITYDADGQVTALSHSGRWAGFETWIGHDVASGLTVAVLSNRGGLEVEDLGEAIGTVFHR